MTRPRVSALLDARETWNGISLARGGMANRVLTGTASALAGAASQSLMTGTSFGDNVLDRLPDVIGQTIGNMVGARVNAAIEARRVEAKAVSGAVSQLATEVLGDGPRTPDEAQQVEALRRALASARRDPDDGDARRQVDREVFRLLELRPDNPNVAAFNDLIFPANPGSWSPSSGGADGVTQVDPLVITGRRGYWAGATVDRAGIWVGENKARIEGRVGQFVAETPGAGVALTVANVGMTIAGGVPRYVAGLALEQVNAQATGWVANQLDRSGWDPAMARSGGDGFVFSASVLLGASASAFRGGLMTGAGGRPGAGAAAESVTPVTPRLLATEGNVGTYRDLIRAGTPGDNITPNHIPSANRMAREGVSRDDAIAINMEQPVPGVGGRHRATFTYGTQADINMSARDALAAGVWDARQIYRRDGLYTPEIRRSLQELIRLNKTQHPDVFRKPDR